MKNKQKDSKIGSVKPGDVFGRLKVIRKVQGTKGPKTKCDCICECGKTKTVLFYHMLSGHTKSCGCIQEEMRKVI
jgi:hypothetical protein